MRKNMLLPLFLLLALSFGCSDKDEPGTIEPALEETSLQEAAPFPFGAAINSSLLQVRPRYKAVVDKEFNSITPEWEMKMGATHPAPNTFSWTAADKIVSYAEGQGKRVHGHTLVWYKSLPTWVTNFQGDAAAWDNLMKNYIQTVVGHYKGRIGSWDVINEVFEEDGTFRNSVWYQHLGEGYIAKAFQYAHEADPEALLFYNDYGHEYGTTKRTAILNLAKKLKAEGVPIHGIGLQMHTRYNMADANIVSAITSAAETGLLVHIAELDIAVNPENDQNLEFTETLSRLQTQKYKLVVETYKAIPAAQQFGITTWNVADADTWIRGNYNRPDWPLLFDDNYNRKQAYQGVLDALK